LLRRTRDPGFVAKLADIVELYVDPPAQAGVHHRTPCQLRRLTPLVGQPALSHTYTEIPGGFLFANAGTNS
jgi:hypothetical protein